MVIKQYVVGPIQTDCYLVADEKERVAMVIDPDLREPGERDRFFKDLVPHGWALRYIVNTHYHVDHIGGNAELKRATGAEILIHERDAPLLAEPWKTMIEMDEKGVSKTCPFCGAGRLSIRVRDSREIAVVTCAVCDFRFEMNASPPADRLLRDGDRIKAGRLEFLVIHTPGHSPGGIALFSKEENAVFTGDTLFKGSIGRTDLPDGSYPDIMKSLAKLTGLPPETKVYPGHGEPTTIADELRENPHLQKPGQ